MLHILVNLFTLISSYYICSYNHTDWYGESRTIPTNWNRVIGIGIVRDNSIITSLCKGTMYSDPPYIASIHSVCITDPTSYLQPKPSSFTTLSHKLDILHSFNASSRYRGMYQSIVYEPIQHMYTICVQTSSDAVFY
jgi:hypothetical protein